MADIDEYYFYKNKDPLKKNTIEDILVDDERILLRLKPNHKVFVLESLFKGLPFALIWAAFDAFFIIMMINSGFFTEEAGIAIPLVILFFAVHLLPVWLFIANMIKRVSGFKNIEYVFTNKRIIVRSGLIGIDFKSLYYSNITGVNVKVGIFDRIFKVGDVYITAINQSAVLEDIEDPYFYMSKIQEIAHDIKTDIEFPNAFRPNENPGYHTDYKKK